MIREESWRFEELADRAAACVNVSGTSRRIRWKPNARTIRYYTTLGLLDRPLFFQGRKAFYGLRHLAQIVAIKRLQSRGLTLEEIQRTLIHLTPDKLMRLADLPERLPEPEQTVDANTRRQTTRFWTKRPKKPRSSPFPSQVKGGAFVTLAPGVHVMFETTCQLPNTSELDELKRAAQPLLAWLAARERGSNDD